MGWQERTDSQSKAEQGAPRRVRARWSRQPQVVRMLGVQDASRLAGNIRRDLRMVKTACGQKTPRGIGMRRASSPEAVARTRGARMSRRSEAHCSGTYAPLFCFQRVTGLNTDLDRTPIETMRGKGCSGGRCGTQRVVLHSEVLLGV